MTSDPAAIMEYFKFQVDDHHLWSLTTDKGFPKSMLSLVRTWVREGKKTIGRIAPDVVIENGVLPTAFSCPSVVVSHDLESKGREIGFDSVRVLYKMYAYRRASAVVATCTELRLALAMELRIEEGLIQVIPTCFEMSEYSGRPLAKRERAILHVGTIRYKNPRATIEAFARLSKGDVRLKIVGKVNEELKGLVAPLPEDVRARVDMLGFVSMDELHRLMGSVRVVSVPSLYDVQVASPTAIEPLLCGTPIAYTAGISNDVVQDGAVGEIVDPSDPDTLAAGLRRLFDDDGLWEQKSRNALAARSRFSSQEVARKYLELSSQLLSRSQRNGNA